MKWVGVFLAVVALIALLEGVRKARAARREGNVWPFYARTLLTPPEQVLYHRLVKALPDVIVLAQVQLSRVLGVKRGFNVVEWNNRINRMSLDFVICRKDGAVLAAVELDDRSHEKASRVAADAKKERALAAAGIRLIRWQASALPDEATIRQALTQSGASVLAKATA